MFGKSHSAESKAKMSQAQSGDKHYMYGKSHSPDTRAKLSLSCPTRISILITDLEKNSVTEHTSIKEAAGHLGISRTTVSRYLVSKLPYKKRYLFTEADS